MHTGNIRKWLEEAEKETGETVEAIVVGRHYDREWDESNPPDENIVLSREEGLKKLDEDFDCGFGGADCYPMYAWTPTRVYFIDVYDGATSLGSVPRNPGPCKPSFTGGQ